MIQLPLINLTEPTPYERHSAMMHNLRAALVDFYEYATRDKPRPVTLPDGKTMIIRMEIKQ